jgi:hypothetical protein
MDLPLVKEAAFPLPTDNRLQKLKKWPIQHRLPKLLEQEEALVVVWDM